MQKNCKRFDRCFCRCLDRVGSILERLFRAGESPFAPDGAQDPQKSRKSARKPARRPPRPPRTPQGPNFGSLWGRVGGYLGPFWNGFGDKLGVNSLQRAWQTHLPGTSPALPPALALAPFKGTARSWRRHLDPHGALGARKCVCAQRRVLNFALYFLALHF